jgi:plastocyanin
MKKTALAALALIAAAGAAALAAAAAPPPPIIHEVRMVVEGPAARFEPAQLTIRPGDRVRFITVSGPPHNVAFDPAKVPAAARAALSAGMPDQMQPLAGPFIMEAGASYTIRFDRVPPGRYEFSCMPHAAMGMTGAVTVR